MPHEVDLILTLTGSLGAALVLGLLTRKIGLSPIVGYLVAGVAVGPFTPGFVADTSLSGQFAEIGVVLLMFGVGLNFHISELMAVRGVAVPGALAGIVGTTALGAWATSALGLELRQSLVFGLTLAVASTVVLLRVLSDANAAQTRIGHIAIGWLVVEDLATVLILVLLPLFAPDGVERSFAAVTGRVALSLAKLVALIAFTWYAGGKAIPALLSAIARTRSRELFTLSVLVVALGIAVGAARLFGASMALGAFLAGLVVGQSDFGSRAASEALPMKDAFAVLFFVSVGMMFDPQALAPNVGLIAAALGVVLVAKPLLAYAVMRLRRLPSPIALLIAVSLGQIGEFSFVVAALGRTLGLLPERSVSVLVAVSITCITVNPLLFGRVRAWAGRMTRPTPHDGDVSGAKYRAIVVGHGPVGECITRILRENQIEPIVLELNHETVAKLKDAGTAAIYGDASRIDVLVAAGIGSATGLILTAPSMDTSAVVRSAIQHNPNLLVLARASFIADARDATRSGAAHVVCDELEVASAMAEHVLARLGATAEQLDSARAEVRDRLLAQD